MRLDDDATTIVQSASESAAFEGKRRRYEIAARGLAREHEAYLRSWNQRMRAALQVSPVINYNVR